MTKNFVEPHRFYSTALQKTIFRSAPLLSIFPNLPNLQIKNFLPFRFFLIIFHPTILRSIFISEMPIFQSTRLRCNEVLNLFFKKKNLKIFFNKIMFCKKICIFLICFSFSIHAASYTAIVSDLKTGSVLAESEAHKAVYPASLTKMMTLYLTFEALSQGKISLETPFHVSNLASKQPPCKWGVRAGQKISVRQCILALSVKSSNDIAYVVAENLEKSTSHFVQWMNAKALKLGMVNTSFRNPSGWHHPLQTTTAYDMALLLRAICKDFPQYAGFLGIASIRKGQNIVMNTNKLLGRVPGVFLGKTGFTCPAGWNLATATNRGGKKIVSVVMGMPSRQGRDKLMAHLIETHYSAPEKLQLAIVGPSKIVSKGLILGKSIPKKRFKRSNLLDSSSGKHSTRLKKSLVLSQAFGQEKDKDKKLIPYTCNPKGNTKKASFSLRTLKKNTRRLRGKIVAKNKKIKSNQISKGKTILAENAIKNISAKNNIAVSNQRIKNRKLLKKQVLCKPLTKPMHKKKQKIS